MNRVAMIAGHAETTGHHRRSVFSRLAPGWLTDLPVSVPQTERKIYFIRLAVPIIGGLLHTSLVLIYFALGLPVMAIVNIVSVLVFVVAAFIVRSGRHYLGTALALAEAAIHAPVVTVLIGLTAGYPLFNYVVAMAAVLVYPRYERRERVVVITYAFFSSVLLVLFMRGREPIITLGAAHLEIIFYLIASSCFLALVGFAHYFVNVSDLAEWRVERELARSEHLLLNILPHPIAQRLKARPGTIADTFDSVTVLFADIVGFTKLSSSCSSSDIVELLNDIFSAFDRIADRYGLEKIKTIGDAYMVVGGVPEKMEDHALKVTCMGLEMIEAASTSRAQKFAKIAIRIGVHSGPVVAGVIGEKKFAYDLWGDTVNIASRMESHGSPGRVQVSAATQKLIAGDFEFEGRGPVEIKGKGLLETFYVLGKKAARGAA